MSEMISAQTPQRFDVRFTTMLGLIAGMALATAAFAAQVPMWLLLALLILGAWRVWSARAGNVKRWGGTRLLLLALAVIAVLRVTGHLGVGLDGAAPLFVTFLWVKLLELNGPRDVLRAFSFCLFLIAAQLLSSQSLLQYVFALLSSLAIFAVFVHYHVVGPADGKGPLSEQHPWRTALRCLRTSSILVAQAAPFAVVLFLFIPRPQIGPGLDQHSASSGVSDTLSPGEMAKVALSSQPAFRVEFSAGARPTRSECYWRGLVLSQTDGDSWGRGTRKEIVEAKKIVRRPNDIEYAITLLPHNRKWLYTLDRPLSIGNNAEAMAKSDLVFERIDPVTATFVYHGVSNMDWQPRDDSARLSSFLVIGDYNKLDSRITDLAAQLKEEASVNGKLNTSKLIDATLKYFTDNHFIYTLEPGAMGANPTATFLFERKRGFCEHYASAFSLLMRLAGVPSRVVVGYYGGEINALGDFMLVRQSNAHAWSEVSVPGEGWRRVDATSAASAIDDLGNPVSEDAQGDPEAFSSARLNDSWLARHTRTARQWWDYVEAKWDRWVLSYDADSLSEVLKRLGLGSLGWWGAALLLMAACTGLWFTMRLMMRHRRHGADPLVLAYAIFCTRLAKAGVIRQAHEGPLAFAQRASENLPGFSLPIIRFADAYIAARYGGGENGRVHAGAKSQQVAALTRLLRGLRPRTADIRRMDDLPGASPKR